MNKILSKTQAEAVYSTMCELNKVHMKSCNLRFGNAIVSSDFNGTIRVIGTTVIDDERYVDQAKFAAAYGLQELPKVVAAMEAVMESVDPATLPGLTTAQRCALGRFAKPQPAEPVGEVLGETCIDGGKCHHGCKERCFRRQCCEPFSDYNDPWKYADEPGSPQPAEPDEWKLAVDHELTNMQSTADSYPSAKEAVRALIDWHVAVATDPVVSGQQRGEPIGSVEVKGGLVVVGVDAEHLGDGIHYLYTGPQPAEPSSKDSDDFFTNDNPKLERR